MGGSKIRDTLLGLRNLQSFAASTRQSSFWTWGLPAHPLKPTTLGQGLTPDAAAFAASMNLDGKVQQAQRGDFEWSEAGGRHLK